MKAFTIVLNLLILCFVISSFVNNGMPDKADDWLLALLITMTPILNIILLKRLLQLESTADSIKKSDTWLSLFLERKKLEEKKKLDKLKNDESST